MKPIPHHRARITDVAPGSLADKAGICPGDVLESVNGHPIRDIIDYEYHVASAQSRLVIEKPDGSKANVLLNNGYDPRIGLGFDELMFDGEKHCANRCVFCFVDQLPKGMRDTLYFKDDDYRLSFLQGNFITLTNLKESDVQRIMDMRLSPLYISVHSTDDAVRRRLLGRTKTVPIMSTLRRLAEGRIQFHSQVVMVPGMNDGEILERTISDLWSLWPSCASMGIVPVGLSRHRKGLPQLPAVSPDVAGETIDIVHRAQRDCMKRENTHFVYAADEFYYLASRPLPEADVYDGYPQLENGIGLARLFQDEFAEITQDLPGSVSSKVRATVVTGVLGAQAIRDACETIARIDGVEVNLLPVKNRFFGESVTVSGLVVGTDIISSLQPKIADGSIGDFVVIPDVMLRSGETRLLDDLTVEDISAAIGVPVVIAESSAAGLVEAILA